MLSHRAMNSSAISHSATTSSLFTCRWQCGIVCYSLSLEGSRRLSHSSPGSLHRSSSSFGRQTSDNVKYCTLLERRQYLSPIPAFKHSHGVCTILLRNASTSLAALLRSLFRHAFRQIVSRKNSHSPNSFSAPC